MAEQINHNVVEQLESTNGSAPSVDVAENHNIAALADSGKQTSSPAREPVSTTTDDQLSHLTERANTAEAEPSAGNAAPTLSAEKHITQDLKHEDDVLDLESPDERAVFDISADPSVASDTDGAVAEQAKDGSLHNRTASVKKPTTFSRVAVSKAFLAKSTATPTAAPKVGDKSAPVAAVQPTALRPRLVAKTAASLGNLTRVKVPESSSGPDASKVWNKNRPAPTLPPKQWTDEELKQQYGIHLATRLQSDEGGKGSKWADIDDDEDDWAPEAVVWMDGTKSTLTPSDTMPVPVEIKSVQPEANPTDAARPTLILGRSSTLSSTAAKTILKPGAAVQAKQQSSAVPMTAGDKAVLVAKSPAPTPSKSPWASLPPVESVSPINPPVQQQQQQQARVHQPFPSQDARAGDPSLMSSLPAREIAADTFDRSWPSAEGETRELFNSANGKYEPAPEGRRNSIRFDRKHSVLRRPSHGVNGAEPMHGQPWSHRRGSSVSQNSGPIQRPMSVAQSIDSHGVLSASSGPDVQLASGASAWSQQLPPVPTGESAEDPVKVQERVMREKREAARKRKEEEEAQEEAAKQARLQAKLAALAGAGQSRKERQQATATPEAAVSKPTEATEPSAAASSNTEQLQAEDAALSPSVEEASSAIAESSPRLIQREQLASSAASRTTFQSHISGSYQTAPSSTFSSPGDRERKPQPFGRAALQGHDAFSSPWPSTGTTNVWGTKGIGNGTFESAFAPITSHHQMSLPPPPGMIRPATTTQRVSPQGLGALSHSPHTQDVEPVVDQHRSLPTPDIDLVPDHFKHHTSIPNQSMGRQQHVPGPIGPPSRAQQAQQTRDQLPSWQDNSSAPYSADAAQLEASGEHRNTNRFKETFKQTGDRSGLERPRQFDRVEYTVHESSVPGPQTQSIPSAGPLDAAKPSGENNVRLPEAPRAQRQSVLPPHLAKVAYTTAPLAPAPQVNDEIPPPPEISSHPVYDGDHCRPNVRLPPPPAVVKLPPAMSVQQHIINQRLPHNLSQHGGARPIVQNEAWQARFNGLFKRTPIQTETPPSPPKTPPKPVAVTPAAVVTSSTRADLDVSYGGPTVSLPRSLKGITSAEGFTLDDSDAVTSKMMVQSMFNEELGFGSRPMVNLPRNVAYGAFTPADINLLAMQSNAQVTDTVDSQSQPDLPLIQLFKKPDAYFVKVPYSTRNRRITKEHFPRAKFPIRGKPAVPSSRSVSKPKETTILAEAKIKSPAGQPASRKASAVKRKASTSPEADVASEKAENKAAGPKKDRKRSSGLKQVVKSAAAGEKPVAAPVVAT